MRSLRRLCVTGLLLTTAFAPGASRAGFASAEAPRLVEGTAFVVALTTPLKSNGTGEGDPVVFRVVNPLYSMDPSHTLMIAKDAIAMGHVIVAHRRGFIGRRGDLQFACDYALNVAGKRVYLRNQCIGGRAHDNGALSVASALVLSTAGLLIQGGDKKYDAGTQFAVYVDMESRLPLEDVQKEATSSSPASQTAVLPKAQAKTP